MNTTTTNQSRKVNIEGMKNQDCVSKVSGAISGIEGVANTAVKVGSATFDANQSNCDQACTAINEAGFKAYPQSKPEKNHTRTDSDSDRKIGAPQASAPKPVACKEAGRTPGSGAATSPKKLNAT